MKKHEVVIKMAFLMVSKCKYPHYCAKWQQKLNFFEVIMKIPPIKREIVFENVNHISFVTCGVTETQNSEC